MAIDWKLRRSRPKPLHTGTPVTGRHAQLRTPRREGDGVPASDRRIQSASAPLVDLTMQVNMRVHCGAAV